MREPHVWTPEAEAKVLKAHSEGWSHRRIAKEVGCTPQNIDQLFKRMRWMESIKNPLCVKLTDEQRREQKERFWAILGAAMGVK